MVLVMGGFYLLFAMMVLVVDESTLETGTHTALFSFTNYLSRTFSTSGIVYYQ
jgi:hypothetical protein